MRYFLRRNAIALSLRYMEGVELIWPSLPRRNPLKCLDTYTVIARHPLLNPVEASQEIILNPRELVTVRFVYLEPERQLLRIEIVTYNMDE